MALHRISPVSPLDHLAIREAELNPLDQDML
jgi:hypothetical protein